MNTRARRWRCRSRRGAGEEEEADRPDQLAPRSSLVAAGARDDEPEAIELPYAAMSGSIWYPETVALDRARTGTSAG